MSPQRDSAPPHELEVINEITKAVASSLELPEIIRITLARIKTLLVEKNAAYGNSALDPVRVFSKASALEGLFTRTDGLGEHYEGEIKRFGIDVGYTKDAQIVWLVFAPGNISSGSLAGSYGGVTVQGTVGVGAGANILVGGSNNQITLQPVSVEGSAGLNVAGGVAEISLKAAR